MNEIKRENNVKSHDMNVDIQNNWTALKNTVLSHRRPSYKEGNEFFINKLRQEMKLCSERLAFFLFSNFSQVSH